jgi:hypothetical protein
MNDRSEWRAVAVSAAALAAVALAWVAGWAVRDARAVHPSRLTVIVGCLEGEARLQVAVPAHDPLAASAPHGSLSTTVAGNPVTVSFWGDAEHARATIATYDRLTNEDLTGRALARGDHAVLWGSPPNAGQESILYGCVG